MPVVSIHQPSYWPWLGQLAKIARTDTYVFLDSVSAAKNENQYRNTFFCNGQAKYLTLPVNYRIGTRIQDLAFLNDDWKADHLNKLTNYYRKAAHFDEVYSAITPVYAVPPDQPVAEFLLATMQVAFRLLGINVAVVKASELHCSGQKGQLVLEICKAVGASKYLAGMGSYEYMLPMLPDFSAAGIEVIWHRYEHPVYRQDPRLPFIAGLACLDILFFHGFDGSRKIFQESLAP